MTESGANNRHVRIFISSTFRDMHQEREVLMKKVFPQLRRHFQDRNVSITEVDLRWGITSDQSQRGEVLSICLAEIDRCRPCRPFFVGLLGERYGWVPDELPAEVLSDQPWLQAANGRSVTELEILHGVLRNPAMDDRAFFYFRDPQYVATLPPDIQRDFREEATDDERRRYGDVAAQQRAAERHQRLAELKARILEHSPLVRENYADPRALGELVLRDLMSAIDRLYPPQDKPNRLDREAAEHEAFGRQRGTIESEGRRHGVYIERSDDYRQLDEHADNVTVPLVVCGEAGSGKSALLANWGARYRKRRPDDFVLTHHVGASADSTDWRAMLRRILGEWQRHFDFALTIPDTNDALRLAFADHLHRVAAMAAERKCRIVLILDGIDQLEDRDGARELAWLPATIPTHVRLIVSTKPGKVLDFIGGRNWSTLSVRGLTMSERERLIKEYLAQYSKALPPNQTQRLAQAPLGENPLFLRALLEELRLFGSHEQLDTCITHYLAAESIPALFQRILERWERDYDGQRPGLVRAAMSCIWAARRGITETELRENVGAALSPVAGKAAAAPARGLGAWLRRLLGNEPEPVAPPPAEPLPQADWSPLLLAAESSLVNRSGLIGFFHDYLSQAVQARYLATDAERIAVHARLARYFEHCENPDRQLEEWPWQLVGARDWNSLYQLLSDHNFFDRLHQASTYDLARYWNLVDEHHDRKQVEAYRAVIRRPEGNSAGFLMRLADHLDAMGHSVEAFQIRRFQVRNRQQLPVLQDQLLLSFEHSKSLLKLGKLDDAHVALCDLEREVRGLGHEPLLAKVLNQQALLAKRRNEPRRALDLHREQEQLCKRTGDEEERLGSLFNQAVNHLRLKETEAAEKLLGDCETAARQRGFLGIVARCLHERAVIAFRQGNHHHSERLLLDKEKICRDLGDKRALGTLYTIYSQILAKRGEVSAALDMLDKKIRLCEEIGDPYELVIALNNRAAILASQPQGRAESQRCLAMALELADRHGFRDLANQIRS